MIMPFNATARHWRAGPSRARGAAFVCLAVLLVGAAGYARANDAQELFAEARASIYQVRVMEEGSGEKAAIGSGFQVRADGLIATNFHVVSPAVHEPDKYQLEYAADDGATGALEIVGFDVVHDLALVRHSAGLDAHLPLADAELENGEALFAVGNPLDLGQSIVPGSYNGLVESSFYRKLLFTGSLNPGMSGGPTLNEAGAVVGVNVSTAGNQISFLVPVVHLLRLLEAASEPVATADYQTRIEAQLVADQARKYGLLLDAPWATQELGRSSVHAAPETYFKCWGDTDDDEDQRYVSTQSSCISQDDIYLSRGFSTGAIDYQFMFIESDELNSLQFSELYSNLFGTMYTRNRARKEDVTNYKCHQDFVAPRSGEQADGAWRTVMCVRQYRDYRALYDVLFLSAYVGGDGEGLSAHFALSGVTRDNANRFAARFIASTSWRS